MVRFKKGANMSKATLHYMDLMQIENRRRRIEAYRFIVGGVALSLLLSLAFFHR